LNLSINVGVFARPRRWERVSRERPGNVLSNNDVELGTGEGIEPAAVVIAPAMAIASAVVIAPAVIPVEGDADPDAEAEAFVRFCYRRRAVAWPELYDEMCAVAARGAYRGMDYDQLRGLGIGFALAALPRLAELAARVIAEERGPQPLSSVAAVA
jgi:hypothetical protein